MKIFGLISNIFDLFERCEAWIENGTTLRWFNFPDLDRGLRGLLQCLERHKMWWKVPVCLWTILRRISSSMPWALSGMMLVFNKPLLKNFCVDGPNFKKFISVINASALGRFFVLGSRSNGVYWRRTANDRTRTRHPTHSGRGLDSCAVYAADGRKFALATRRRNR